MTHGLTCLQPLLPHQTPSGEGSAFELCCVLGVALHRVGIHEKETLKPSHAKPNQTKIWPEDLDVPKLTETYDCKADFLRVTF